MSRVCLRVLLALFVSVHCLPLSEARFRTASISIDQLEYLKQYGYLPRSRPNTARAFDRRDVREAVKLLQTYGGLTATGNIDTATAELFKKPRCGVKDVFKYDDGGGGVTPSLSRRKRYVISYGGAWKKGHLVYRFINKSSKIPSDVVEKEFAAALALWALHAGLTFTKVEQGAADINVAFYRGEHGCGGDQFNGPNGVLAHAYAPAQGGALHFDDDEHWYTEDEPRNETATRFFVVALHEIGHVLGLNHATVIPAVMNPYYNPDAIALLDDDISGMKELYPDTYTSVPDQDSTKNNSTQSPMDLPPNLCDCNFDTIQNIWGKIYVFKDQWLWVLSDLKELQEGYPKRLHEVFPGLPNIRAVDAAYETYTGSAAIFSGRNIYYFNNKHQLISIGNLSDLNLTNLTLELGAVFLWNVNNKTYLFEKEHFWRFDESSNQMDEGYPMSIGERWRNGAYPISSALLWKEETYFFRGCLFWRFHISLVTAARYYPVPVAPVWFPCHQSLSVRELSELEQTWGSAV